MTTLLVCLLFTALVAGLTYFFTRGKGTADEEGYFLAGRSLGGVVIAGSLLLTNLSTEQLIGLNGGAFEEGLSVMAWEVVAGISLILLALFFLPRYLKSGITTIPQFLEERYGKGVRVLTTVLFLIAYTFILLPFVLYMGAQGLSSMLDLEGSLGLSERATVWVVVLFVALVGSCYAIFGGLRAVAVSDTFNGVGLLVGGALVTYFALQAVDASPLAALREIKASNPDAFQSLGKPGESVHWPTLFTGVLLLNVFYWTTNQQIIQRTFAAKNLAEGQKGVLLAAFFKILAPLILVLPGIVAAHLVLKDADFAARVGGDSGNAYGVLVRAVLPPAFTGFFAAVVIGSILSTFNSVLNSSATLFSLGLYKGLVNPAASSEQTVRFGRRCSLVVGIFAALAAPTFFLGHDSLFAYFQSLNGIYFIPLLAIVLVGMFNKTANGTSALISALLGLAAMGYGTFAGGGAWAGETFGSGFHFMGLVFLAQVILQWILGLKLRRSQPYVQADAHAVDLTPWKHAKPVGGILFFAICAIYYLLS